MAEAAVEQIECGFCLRKEGVMENPKTLPCTHIHCLECLTDNYSANGIVRCPFCREVVDVDLESLPSANVREDKSVCCDVCSKKSVDNQPAVTYCTVCTSKYCTEHGEHHDAIHMEHPMLTIDEYIIQDRKLQPRMCTVHKELQYSLGCRSCLTLICTRCIDEQAICTDGGAHKMMSIDKLVAELTAEMDKMRAELTDKEENLSALFKLTSRIISEFDTETEKMVHTIHKTRDEQMEAIQLKYKKLEDELMELRRSVKSTMTRFMEEDVGVKWTELGTHRLQIDAGLKRNHQGDVVNRYEDSRMEIQKLISNELPTLELQNMVTLEVKDIMVNYYGQCKLCEQCTYMGPDNKGCACEHSSYDHVELGPCQECEECGTFSSTATIPSCYTCGHHSSAHQVDDCASVVKETLKSWVLQGIPQPKMTELFFKKFDRRISTRTLSRRLTKYGLNYTQDHLYSDDVVLQAVRLENNLGVVGYQKLHKLLRVKHRMFVSRDRLHTLIRSDADIPKGRDPNIAHRQLRVKPFISEVTGPNQG